MTELSGVPAKARPDGNKKVSSASRSRVGVGEQQDYVTGEGFVIPTF